MKQYVMGLAFDAQLKNVLMIHKNRGPGDVVGKWNGIGGKIDPEDETPMHAMRREMAEETGLQVPIWRRVGNFNFTNHNIFVFTQKDVDISFARTMEDEPVRCHPLEDFHNVDTTSFVRWLVPCALWTLEKNPSYRLVLS